MIFPKAENKRETTLAEKKLAEVKSAVSGYITRINELKAMEKDAIEKSRSRLESETGFLEEQRQVLANEVRVLELRREQALEPIEKELQEINQLREGIAGQTSALEEKEKDLKEFENRLETKTDVIEKRFAELEKEMGEAHRVIKQAKAELLTLERTKSQVQASQGVFEAEKTKFFKKQKDIWDKMAVKEVLMKAEAKRIEDMKAENSKEAAKAAYEKEKLGKVIEILKKKGLWQTAQEMTIEK